MTRWRRCRPDRVGGSAVTQRCSQTLDRPRSGNHGPPRLRGVLTRIDLRTSAGSAASSADPRRLLPRAALDVAAAMETVRPVVEAVRDHGGAAVREATERFDGVRLSSLRVPAAAVADAVAGLDAGVRAGLDEAITRARTVH